MSFETTRQSVVSAVESVKAGAPGGAPVIEYDNRIIVDTQTQSAPFMCVELIYMDGEQADLAAKPIHRTSGVLRVSAAAKDGDGSAKANALLDYFCPLLQGKQFGAVRTKYAKPIAPRPHLGWVYFTVLIPFWVDTQTS